MFMSNGRMRTASLLLLIVFLMLLFTIFMLMHADHHEHDHNGPNGTCAACTQVFMIAQNLLKNIASILFVLAALNGILVLAAMAHIYHCKTWAYTLVALKTRFNT